MSRRLTRLTDRRDDLQHELDHWGWASSWTPSRTRKRLARIARLTERIDRLTAKETKA